MFVIMKKTRLYLGGVGYAGPTCDKAGVEPGKVYTDFATACIDAGKLEHYNPVGFEVLDFREEKVTHELPR